jgi:hypothetical protein
MEMSVEFRPYNYSIPIRKSSERPVILLEVIHTTGITVATKLAFY